jgi:hypothetical protein
MATFDPQALREKYRTERDKRLRPDGNDQYIEMANAFARYLDDPYCEPVERAPLTEQFLESCTPGYYNNEGRPAARSVRDGFYGAGSPAFIRVLEDWRARGDLNGLELT